MFSFNTLNCASKIPEKTLHFLCAKLFLGRKQWPLCIDAGLHVPKRCFRVTSGLCGSSEHTEQQLVCFPI